MAYRTRRTRSTSRRPSGGFGGRRSAGRTTRGRTASRGVRSGARRSAPQTLRLVIETTQASAVARPEALIGAAAAEARKKAKF